MKSTQKTVARKDFGKETSTMIAPDRVQCLDCIYLDPEGCGIYPNRLINIKRKRICFDYDSGSDQGKLKNGPNN